MNKKTEEYSAKYYTIKAGNSNDIPIYTRSRKKDYDKNYYFEEYVPIESLDTEKKRTKEHLHFEHLMENIQEALTSSKCKKHFDNSYLEFLGDGVLSVLLAWDLVMKLIYKNSGKQGEIDSLRIQNSNSRKLIEL